MVKRQFPGELPKQRKMIYSVVGHCIYCGAKGDLRTEHIVPFGLGGNTHLPAASCRVCEATTSAFEGTCLRTILGPLRMTYGMKSRRPKKRPEKLPLKEKYAEDEDWQEFLVPREECPYLILMPRWSMSDELSGYDTIGQVGASTNKIWIRGSPSEIRREEHYEFLCQKYGFHSVMPTGEVRVEEFCRLLAKIAHSFATAELADSEFEPCLQRLILEGDFSKRAQWIGSLAFDEPSSTELHEISLDQHTCSRPNVVSVRIRLLGVLGTPTYFIVAGHRNRG